MLADFGLSKYLAEIKSNSKILGMPAYIEPQCFTDNKHKRNEKSDIYSLGVLFWEISSGKPPFSETFIYKISLDIVKGIRETQIDKTPLKYQQLYEKCWKEEPNQRPDIDEIYKILIEMKSQFNNNEHININNSVASYGDSNLKILFNFLFIIIFYLLIR